MPRLWRPDRSYLAETHGIWARLNIRDMASGFAWLPGTCVKSFPLSQEGSNGRGAHTEDRLEERLQLGGRLRGAPGHQRQRALLHGPAAPGSCRPAAAAEVLQRQEASRQTRRFESRETTWQAAICQKCDMSAIGLFGE